MKMKDIKKLNVKNGDVIILRTTEFYSVRDVHFLEEIRNLFKGQNKEISVIQIPASMDIEKLSEKQMNKIGWYKNEGDDFSSPNGFLYQKLDSKEDLGFG